MNETDHHVDRTGWTAGPWDGEPDRVEWRHAGVACLIVRSVSTGALCGYVGVPPAHPWHGLPFDVVEASTHGGLSYSEKCSPPICHVPAPGEPDDVWWLGFDCGHCWDVMPALTARYGKLLAELDGGRARYRDVAYVKAEVEQLADQVIAAAPGT